MHGSRSKIPSKNLVRQHCAKGFNSGVKGLNNVVYIRAVQVIMVKETVHWMVEEKKSLRLFRKQNEKQMNV
jgi:hypothetical protein